MIKKRATKKIKPGRIDKIKKGKKIDRAAKGYRSSDSMGNGMSNK